MIEKTYGVTKVVYDFKQDEIALLQELETCYLISYDGTIWRVMFKDDVYDVTKDNAEVGEL